MASRLEASAGDPARVRAFVAIDVSQEVRDHVVRVQEALRPAGARVKWVAPEQCHLTLKFLGYVQQASLPDISVACARVAAAADPFELEFRGLGAFPRWRGARVLWLGIRASHDELVKLQLAVEAQLAPLGFPPEGRPFSPHLTLGRLKEPPARQAAAALETAARRFDKAAFGRVRVASLQLMRSVLRPIGPEYSVLEFFALGAASQTRARLS